MSAAAPCERLTYQCRRWFPLHICIAISHGQPLLAIAIADGWTGLTAPMRSRTRSPHFYLVVATFSVSGGTVINANCVPRHDVRSHAEKRQFTAADLLIYSQAAFYRKDRVVGSFFCCCRSSRPTNLVMVDQISLRTPLWEASRSPLYLVNHPCYLRPQLREYRFYA